MATPEIAPPDADLARRLLRAQFPRWADLPVTPLTPGGWDNRTFRLGESLSVRLPTARHYAAQAERELALLPGLGRRLPLPITEPIALGRPGEGFPLDWTVNRWLEGEAATHETADTPPLAADLGAFLRALHQADAAGAPEPGQLNFHRGGDLAVYDPQVREALRVLGAKVDQAAVAALWDAALASRWQGPPVWVHGDVAPGNLLLEGGRLAAVIDWGQICAGDPACDLVIAWTTFTEASRRAFRQALPRPGPAPAAGRSGRL